MAIEIYITSITLLHLAIVELYIISVTVLHLTIELYISSVTVLYLSIERSGEGQNTPCVGQSQPSELLFLKYPVPFLAKLRTVKKNL
jgi:hypothetical protein